MFIPRSAPSRMAERQKRSSEDSLPASLEIVDVEKRKGLTKYYVYIIRVTRKNGTKYIICRSFDQFSEMQSHLEERFIIEAGTMNPKDRILPTLPSKIYLGRSNIREVTDRRLPLLNEYLKGLFTLPNNIRYDSIVMAFIKPTSEDVKYSNEQEENEREVQTSKTQPRRPPPPRTGRPTLRPAVPVAPPPTRVPPPPNVPPPQARLSTRIPLPPNVPPPSPVSSPPQAPLPLRPPLTMKTSVPLPGPSRPPLTKKMSVPVTGQPKEKSVPRGKALYSYTALHGDELSFSEGTIVYLLSQSGEWYKGKVNGKTGLVPANYIQVIEPLAAHTDVMDTKQDGQQSDEWDDDADKEVLTCHYYGDTRMVDVDRDTLEHATVPSLLRVIRGHLKRRDIVLNYKDRTGDLIEITDKKDIEMMKREAALDGNHSWTLHVTRVGDHEVYNTHPYA